ncbi:diguanylate cyclase domain-containing protein [Quadrisphaera oryzae]|uniref:GGDEF domain-containing protein n=1 Tax=Quadrisphaera TaxID=317661 RepID=UPI0016470754|nr:GGDEF domain-containing protein [Quadrisphaera sp. RL12-1S]MBC3761274.1 GGDEF domain-containing protein [Quadrisphaera sp. RL12-1S]
MTDAQGPAPAGPPRPHRPGTRRRLLAVSGLGCASALVMAAVGPLRNALGVPGEQAQAVVDLLLLALAVAVLVLFAVRCVRIARAGGGRRATAPWVVFTAAMACYSTAQGRFAVVEVWGGGDPRQDPGTIACYIAAAVLAPLAVVLAVRAVHPPVPRVRTLLDGLLAGGGLFVLSWLAVLGPALGRGDVPLAAVVFTASTVVGAVVLVTAALTLAVRCRPSPSLALLAGGSVVMATCQVAYLLMVRSGTFAPGGWISVGYAVALVAFVGAAVAEDGVPVARERPRAGGPLAALPYLPLVVAVPAVLLEATHRQLGLVELGGTLLLTTALVLRQGLVVAENSRLARQLQERSAALAHLAYTDQLTGLANRTAFTGALQSALDAAADAAAADDADAPGRSVLVAFCDLDGFKAVNDASGHAAGDSLLVAVAQRLRHAVRAEDVVARLGGDEFAVLVTDAGPRAAGARAAADLRDLLRCALSAPFTAGADRSPTSRRPSGTDDDAVRALDRVSASVGAVSSSDVDVPPGGRVDAHDLLREADHRMYAAKRRHHAARVR